MRWLVRCLMALLPLVVVGCAGDPREAKITTAIGYLDQAATDLSTVKDSVDSAIKKQANKKLNAPDMKAASTAIENLKTLSKKMQETKQQIENLAGSTSPERKDALRDQFQKKLSGAMARVEEERLLLQKSLAAAEAIDPDPVKDLRSKLTEAEGNFEALARQR